MKEKKRKELIFLVENNVLTTDEMLKLHTLLRALEEYTDELVRKYAAAGEGQRPVRKVKEFVIKIHPEEDAGFGGSGR